MKVPALFPTADRRRQLGLAAILILQSIAAVFFVADAGVDLLHTPLAGHSLLEAMVTLALVAGIVLSTRQLRRAMDRMAAQERTIGTARGDLGRIIEAQFAAWGLTPAERDVGLLALKGLDPADIAKIRGAAPSTVRAQLTRIYGKAGVSGRAQFAAWFVEDLLDNGISVPDRRPE